MQRRHFLAAGLTAISTLPFAGRVQAQSEPLKIGFLIPKSGPAGLFGPSSEASIAMAVETINAGGGILGRPIEALIADAGGSPSDTMQAAQRLWRRDGVEAMIGQHDSAAREAVSGMLKGALPYIYTPVNEGSYCTDGVYTIGETPAQQLGPSIPWLSKEKTVSKWYLIGNDYSWPRMSNDAAKPIIAAAGGTIVGEEYLPFTVDNFDSSLARIRESGADAILITLVGGASVAFNRAFASFGLDAQAIRLGTLIEENTLMGIGAGNANRLYSVSGFFDALQTPEAKSFRDAYLARFGADAPVLNTLGESCFEGALFLKAVIEKAGGTDPAAFATAAEGATWTGPRGTARMTGRFASASTYLAEGTDAGFAVVQSFGDVAPGSVCTG